MNFYMKVFASYPISYSIEITYLCTNACPMCSNVWGLYQYKTLSNWKLFLDTVFPEKNRNKYAEIIRITGGEPTLHPDFLSIINYIDSFDIPFVIFSNGKWSNPNVLISTMKKLKNLEGLLMSLHGVDAFTHAKFTCGNENDYNEICNNIERATNSGLTVFTNTVITKYVCSQLEGIIDLSKNLGASCSVFNRLIGFQSSLEPTKENLRDTIKAIDSLKSQGVSCQLGNCIPQCFIRNSSYGANSGIEHCVISPDGLIRPDNHTDIVFGNIFEQSIEEIWTSQVAQKYRLQISNECLKCIYVNRCRGGIKGKNCKDDVVIDLLMTKPITEENIPDFEFGPNMIPNPYYNIRKNIDGYIACRYNWSIPFPEYMKDIYLAIDGKTTLNDLYERYGENILKIIGYLYDNDFIGININD